MCYTQVEEYAMVRMIEVLGDQLEMQPDGLKIHTNVGRGRVISAILRIEEPQELQTPLADPFGKELDDLLAVTPPVEGVVDDSREAIYTPDEELFGNKRP